MKKFLLKLKILKTNISRIIMSFLFINVGTLFPNISRAAFNLSDESWNNLTMVAPDCYDRATNPIERIEMMGFKPVFILIVPIVVLILIIMVIINKKNKQKNIKKENKDVKK